MNVRPTPPQVVELEKRISKLENTVIGAEQISASRSAALELRMSSIEGRQVRAESILMDLLVSATDTRRSLSELTLALESVGNKLTKLLAKDEAASAT